MNNYIKPSANVIEIAVKERLSRTSTGVRKRTYDIKVGINTKIKREIETNIYTSNAVSKIRWSDEA